MLKVLLVNVEIAHSMERPIDKIAAVVQIMTNHVVGAEIDPGLPGAPHGSDAFHEFGITTPITPVHY